MYICMIVCMIVKYAYYTGPKLLIAPGTKIALPSSVFPADFPR